jgi:hypothetical protein
LENLNGRDQSEDLDVDGRIILQWILDKQILRLWSGFFWLRLGTVTRCCEHGNETSGSMKDVKLIN